MHGKVVFDNMPTSLHTKIIKKENCRQRSILICSVIYDSVVSAFSVSLCIRVELGNDANLIFFAMNGEIHH